MAEANKKPGVAFWVTVGVVLLLVYPVSFGPACWVYSRTAESESWATVWDTANRIYYPILKQWNGEGTVSRAIDWYANLGSAAEVYPCWPTHGSPDELSIGTGEPE